MYILAIEQKTLFRGQTASGNKFMCNQIKKKKLSCDIFHLVIAAKQNSHVGLAHLKPGLNYKCLPWTSPVGYKHQSLHSFHHHLPLQVSNVSSVLFGVRTKRQGFVFWNKNVFSFLLLLSVWRGDTPGEKKQKELLCLNLWMRHYLLLTFADMYRHK